MIKILNSFLFISCNIYNKKVKNKKVGEQREENNVGDLYGSTYKEEY